MGDYWVEVSRGIPRSQDKIVKGEVLEGVAELNPSKLPAEIQKGLKPILINFESFSTGLVSLFNPTTIDDLKQSIANIKESTLKAKTLTDKFDIEGEGIKLDMQVFNETMANLSKVSSELKISLDNIEDASRNFKKASEDIKDISGKLNNGEGSLGKLINDSDLYDSIGSVVNNIGVLIKKLSDDPTLIRPSIWK